MSIFKILRIPSGDKVEIKAHDTYSVRWWSMGRIDGHGIADKTVRVEVFPDHESAIRFAGELVAAAKLLQDFMGSYGDGWGPFVEKNTYKGN